MKREANKRVGVGRKEEGGLRAGGKPYWPGENNQGKPARAVSHLRFQAKQFSLCPECGLKDHLMKGQLAAGQAELPLHGGWRKSRGIRGMPSPRLLKRPRERAAAHPPPPPLTQPFPRKPFFMVSSPHVQKKMAP